jgi:L-ascorbate metabolism protein UlaG (beta-lactamase superfamily)
MIGHSTVLIEIDGTRILTDPYFGEWGHLAYARRTPPAGEREELKDIDAVLVSHAHWDHTDRKFFRSLSTDVPVVTSKWATSQIRWLGARKPVGLSTWEAMRVGNLAITAVPAVHVTLAVGYVIEGGGECLYFAGDTYHRPFMKELGRRFAIDVALLPVTTYRVPMTMGERSAVRAVRDLSAPVILPIHEGVIPRSPVLRTRQTPERFKQQLVEAGVAAEVVILKDGESWTSRSQSLET